MVKNIFKKYKMYGFKKFCHYMFLELLRILYWEKMRCSYSQKQEDLVIDKILGNKNKGFYVDVGAHDPHRFSNAKRFYKKGWTGINIEPNRVSYSEFQKCRPRDINLNIGVASTEGSLVFFDIDPNTLSTFSELRAKEYQKQGFAIISKQNVEAKRLESILDKYAQNKEIDFMSIDTEGYDMEVLRSNDWNKYRPKLICIESVTHEENDKDSKQRQENYALFFESIHYKKAYDNGLNSIYLDEEHDYEK